MLSSKVSFYNAEMKTMFSVRNLVVNRNNNLFYVGLKTASGIEFL